MAVITTGFNRISTAFARSTSGIGLDIIPGATVYVTSTATGGGATIYYDPGMSVAISGSTVTADVNGNYSYYAPLNYCMTEVISAPSGGSLTLVNISQNSALTASLTTTASASDTVAITGVKSTSHVTIQATNSTAAALTGVYVTKTTGSVTVFHSSTANGTFDIIVIP